MRQFVSERELYCCRVVIFIVVMMELFSTLLLRFVDSDIAQT